MPFEIFSERKNGETNSKYAYRLLRESIMSFKLLPGEALDETVINEQFGTSRTPVREALILLKNEKLGGHSSTKRKQGQLYRSEFSQTGIFYETRDRNSDL